jgi:hypothetical protein
VNKHRKIDSGENSENIHPDKEENTL